MILQTTHQSIVAVLASSPATQPDFSSTAAVLSGATRSGYRQRHGTLNSTTEVVVVENPSGSESRDIVDIQIANRHSSAVVCTVSLKEGNTYRVLVETSIGVDETLQWTGSEWKMFPEPASSIGAASITVTDDVTVGDDLVVTDDASVGGDLVVTGSGTFGSISFTSLPMIAAKGDLLAGTANDTVGILTAAANYHILQTNSTEATGLQWSHRCHLWHSETADASAHHTSSSESAALYSSTAIPTAMINEQRKMLRVRTWGKASTTSAPTLTLRIKLNDTSVSQAIGTITGTSPGSGVTDRMVEAEAWFVVRTTGSSGTIQGFQRGQHSSTGTYGRGVITLNLTNDITVEVTAQWSASSASNTVTLEGFTVEILN